MDLTNGFLGTRSIKLKKWLKAWSKPVPTTINPIAENARNPGIIEA